MIREKTNREIELTPSKKKAFFYFYDTANSQNILDFIDTLKRQFSISAEAFSFCHITNGWVFETTDTAFEIQTFPDRTELIHTNGSLLPVAVVTDRHHCLTLHRDLLDAIVSNAPSEKTLTHQQQWHTPKRPALQTLAESTQYRREQLHGRVKNWLREYAKTRKSQPDNYHSNFSFLLRSVGLAYKKNEKIEAADALFRSQPLTRKQVNTLNNGWQKNHLTKIMSDVSTVYRNQDIRFLLLELGYQFDPNNEGGYIYPSISEDSFLDASRNTSADITSLMTTNARLYQELDDIRINSQEDSSINSDKFMSPPPKKKLMQPNFSKEAYPSTTPPTRRLLSSDSEASDDSSVCSDDDTKPSSSQSIMTTMLQAVSSAFSYNTVVATNAPKRPFSKMELATCLNTSFSSNDSAEISSVPIQRTLSFSSIGDAKRHQTYRCTDKYSQTVETLMKQIIKGQSLQSWTFPFSTTEQKQYVSPCQARQKNTSTLSLLYNSFRSPIQLLEDMLKQCFTQLNTDLTILEARNYSHEKDKKELFFSQINTTLKNLVVTAIRLALLNHINGENLDDVKNYFSNARKLAQSYMSNAVDQIIPDLHSEFMSINTDLDYLANNEQAASLLITDKTDENCRMQAINQRLGAIPLYLQIYRKQLNYFPENKALSDKIQTLEKEEKNLRMELDILQTHALTQSVKPQKRAVNSSL